METFTWLVFLVLIKYVSQNAFELEVDKLTATEGSCSEIKYKVRKDVYDHDAYWFWMKDARWDEKAGDYNATVVYSTNNLKRPVSPDFANRVKFTGSSSSSWKNGYSASVKPLCSILICDLRKNDTGVYSFRFKGNVKEQLWKSPEMTLTVEGNRCPLTFEQPLVVVESDTVNLTCSTSTSCPSNPQIIQDVTQTSQTQVSHTLQDKTRTFSFRASWKDNGRMFSCRTEDNTDKYLIRNITVTVKYAPKNVRVQAQPGLNVKENMSLTLSCIAEANPPVRAVTWRKTTDGRDKIIQQTQTLTFTVKSASPSDSGLYSCEATNDMGTVKSQPAEVQVRYPPTEPKLSMLPCVTEGQTITIGCTVESFPFSTLTLKRSNTDRSFPENNGILLHSQSTNSLSHKLAVTWVDAGWYRCTAQNSEGSKDSPLWRLDVKYAPKNVRVQAQPGLDVKENMSLTLSCIAESNPPVRAVTWRKTTDGRDKIIQQTQTLTFTVKSASPSDSGLYSCEATNDMGTVKSQPAEVQVRFAPKDTNIMGSPEKQEPDGRSSVTLSCISHSFPPVHHYSWYRKIKGEEKGEEVSQHQNHTVYSNQPGGYYCVAVNEVAQTSSDQIHLFDRDFLDTLMFLLPALFLLMIIILIVTVFRYRRKKSIQQGTSNNTFLFVFLDWCYGTRRRILTNETVSAEPFRSRDNLLSEQLRRPRGQQRQPLPDSTQVLYTTLNLPQAAAPQNPTRQQDGNREGESVNYAFLHFQNKNMQRKAEVQSVYAMVSKPMRVKKEEPDSLQVYENINNATARAPKSPNLFDDNTSEGEVELDYSLVSFTAMPRRQATNRDSSSSEEDEIHYSDVKI